MKQKDERDIELTQQGDNSTSLVGDQPQVFQVDGDLYYQVLLKSPDRHCFLSPRSLSLAFLLIAKICFNG